MRKGQKSSIAAKAEFPPVTMDPDMRFVTQPLREAFAYWASLCGARKFPHRAQLLPNAMRSFITHVGLVEVHASQNGPPIYFVRLLGARIEDVIGRRAGRVLGDDLPEDLAVRWRRPFDWVFEGGRPLRIRSRVAYEGKTWLETENFYAPLGERDTTPDAFFVGCSVLAAEEPHRADTR